MKYQFNGHIELSRIVMEDGELQAGPVAVENITIHPDNDPDVVVNYTLNGEKRELGLRFNAAAGIFLDHPDQNPALAHHAEKLAPAIGKLVQTARKELAQCWPKKTR